MRRAQEELYITATDISHYQLLKGIQCVDITFIVIDKRILLVHFLNKKVNLADIVACAYNKEPLCDLSNVVVSDHNEVWRSAAKIDSL